jgi:hypothetical protein
VNAKWLQAINAYFLSDDVHTLLLASCDNYLAKLFMPLILGQWQWPLIEMIHPNEYGSSHCNSPLWLAPNAAAQPLPEAGAQRTL